MLFRGERGTLLLYHSIHPSGNVSHPFVQCICTAPTTCSHESLRRRSTTGSTHVTGLMFASEWLQSTGQRCQQFMCAKGKPENTRCCVRHLQREGLGSYPPTCRGSFVSLQWTSGSRMTKWIKGLAYFNLLTHEVLLRGYPSPRQLPAKLKALDISGSSLTNP